MYSYRINIMSKFRNSQNRKNYFSNSVRPYKIIILLEYCFGINRLYLLSQKKKFHYFHPILLFCFTSYIIFTYSFNKSNSLTYAKYFTGIEYMFLIAVTALSSEKKWRNFFKNLSEFDESLKIDTLNRFPVLLCILMCFFVSSLDFVIFMTYFNKEAWLLLFIIFLSNFAHEVEQILYCALLKSTFERVKMFKSYILINIPWNNKGIHNVVWPREHLNVEFLHKSYELLHKSSTLLNSLMKIPVRHFLYFLLITLLS